jgi:phosphoglucosamine mutase
MGRFFGTDGIRGVANADLSTDLVDRLGRAAVHVLAPGGGGRFAVGRDPRISGDLLEAALVAACCSAGADVLRLGVLPTPGIALLTRDLEVHAGAVISASHNPMEDNGVKLFAPTGFKFPDEMEARIEVMMDESGTSRTRRSGTSAIWPRWRGRGSTAGGSRWTARTARPRTLRRRCGSASERP